MENDDYTFAEGPAGLERVLNEFLERAENDPTFSDQAHYILYEMGNQRSLIRVDASQKPFKFWHFDLMGRPATQVIKETIVRFLWEKCGVKEKYIDDHMDY